MNSIQRLAAAAAALIASAGAHAEIAVVVHPNGPLASMTAEEVAAVYLGRDTRLQPIDLPESGGLRNWFYYHVTGRNPVQINILRAQLIAHAPPTRAANSADAIRRVAANKRAIAYVDTRVVDASVKIVMTIDTPEVLDRLRGAEANSSPKPILPWLPML